MKDFQVMFKYNLKVQMRSGWLLASFLFYFLLTFTLLQTGSDSVRLAASLLNVVVLFNPAVSIFYSTISWYHSLYFNQLMLTQPTTRSRVLLANWLSLLTGLSVSFVFGIGLPMVLTQTLDSRFLHLAFVGVLLNCIFSSLGILIGVMVLDRMRGVVIALGIWFYFSVIHDALLFLVLTQWRDYPLEKIVMAIMIANPLDSARLYLLTQFDFAALMGYTGALLKSLAEHPLGFLFFIVSILSWCLLIPWQAMRIFKKRDL